MENKNSGNYNSGNYNSGDYNSGSRNSGDWNSCNYNSGDWNSGTWNSGDCNSGDCNSGDWNSGDWNSGDWNSGNYNSGDYNSGDYNSGFFNTDEPSVRMFNKDTDLKRSEINIPCINLKVTEWIPKEKMTDEQKTYYPFYKTTGGFLLKRSYKEAWALAWSELDQEEKEEFLSLPNFDSEIFKNITGIDVGAKDYCDGKIVEIEVSDDEGWHPYTEPKKLKRFWQWKVRGDYWYRPDFYLDDDGIDTAGSQFYTRNTWESLEKIKIEDDYIEVEE